MCQWQALVKGIHGSFTKAVFTAVRSFVVIVLNSLVEFGLHLLDALI
jgi:hypothetical protein